MLERVVPLIQHPSDALIHQLDTRLTKIVQDGGMILIASAVSCMSAIYNKFRKKTLISGLFLTYLGMRNYSYQNIKNYDRLPREAKNWSWDKLQLWNWNWHEAGFNEVDFYFFPEYGLLIGVSIPSESCADILTPMNLLQKRATSIFDITYLHQVPMVTAIPKKNLVL